MLTVSYDVSVVELDLMLGLLFCPECAGILRPWGSARVRSIRHGAGAGQHLVRHHPRRARCAACLRTHVLLPLVLAARRADSADVIAAAVVAKVVGGAGHRALAVGLGRPASTVRGWLRSFAASAGQVALMFTDLLLRDAVDAAAIWPAATLGAAGMALSAVWAYAEALRGRFAGVGEVTWVQVGVTACNGWLFCAPWWAGRSNTNPPLPISLPVASLGEAPVPTR